MLYASYGAVQFSMYRNVAQALKATPMPASISFFASGALAGAAATLVTYPFDLLRTRFAAQGPAAVYTSVYGGLRAILSEEGGSGLFRGAGAAVGQIMPYMGLFFSSYELLHPIMADQYLSLGTGDAVAGAIASTFSKAGVFPLDLVRRRLQVQGPRRELFVGGMVPEYNRGVWSTGRSIVAREGWRGLYRGLVISLMKAAPASAVTMWTYEHALRELQRLDIGE